jgi:hypothetical protein
MSTPPVVPAAPPRAPTRQDELARLIFAGAAGTALAAATFPAVLLPWAWWADALGPPSPSGDGLMVLFAWVFGTYLVATVAGAMACLLALAAWVVGLGGRRIWFASLVGGSTGFAFSWPALLVFQPESLVQTAAATWWGQAGAAWCASRTLRLAPPASDAAPPGGSRFGLRQLFAATTAVCLAAAVLGSLQVTLRGYGLILAGIGLQLFAIGVAGTAAPWVRRLGAPFATDDVSRETSAPA